MKAELPLVVSSFMLYDRVELGLFLASNSVITSMTSESIPCVRHPLPKLPCFQHCQSLFKEKKKKANKQKEKTTQKNKHNLSLDESMLQ